MATDLDEVHVEICARPPHTAFLVVAYNGRVPPRRLFADLEMIGWTAPAVAPPPKSAIDWSTPDPATGERFTVGDWAVDGAIVEPPPGHGPRGSWLPAERAARLASLHGVLARHAVGVTNRLDRDSPDPSDRAADPAAALRPTVRDMARRRSLRADAAAMSRPPAPTSAPADAEALEPEPTSEPAPDRGDGDRALVRAMHPCLHLIVDPPIEPRVIDEIARAALRHWHRDETTVATVGTYRGTQHATSRRAVHLKIWVPDTHLTELVERLVHAARLDPEDDERCWVTMPAPRREVIEPSSSG